MIPISALQRTLVAFGVGCTVLAGFGGTAKAQSVPSTGDLTYRLEVTKIQPSRIDKCGLVDHYVKLRLDNGSTITINPDIQYEGSPGADCFVEAPKPYGALLPVNNVFVEVTKELCTASREIHVRIELWKRKGAMGGDNDTRVLWGENTYDGPTNGELCVTSSNGEDGGFCFTIEGDSPHVDSDGDGLSDQNEIHGVDVDCDGYMDNGVDLFLHEMGVDPGVKDMLLEVNWFDGEEPQLDSLVALKNSYWRAPEDAGGIMTPGQGVNLIIDAGDVYSDLPAEHTIGGRNAYDADMNTDVDEELCKDLEDRDGNIIPLAPSNVAPLGEDAARSVSCQHDTARRRGYFRQVLMGPQFDPTVGGIFLGNDRIYMLTADLGKEIYRFMHELGHSLDLSHGGGSLVAQQGSNGGIPETNCEMNNMSVMNYMYSNWTVNGPSGLLSDVSGLPFINEGDLKVHYDYAPAKVPDTFEVSEAQMVVTDGSGTTVPFSFELQVDAEKVTLSLFLMAALGGNIEIELDGPQLAGSIDAEWDGLAADGTIAIAGDYRLSVIAEDDTGTEILNEVIYRWVEKALTPPTDCAGTCNHRMFMPDLDENCLVDGSLMRNDVPNDLFWRYGTIRVDDGTPANGSIPAIDPAAIFEPVTQIIDWNFDGIDSCSVRNLDKIPWKANTDACNGTDLTVIGPANEWAIIVIPPGRGVFGSELEIVQHYDDVHDGGQADLTASFTADLQLSATANPEPVTVGDQLALSVTATNAGPGLAIGGYVDVALPAGTSAATVPAGCELIAGETYRCTLIAADGVFPIASGSSLQFDFTIDITANATSGQRNILVSTSHNGPEVAPADNTVAIPIITMPAFLDFEDDERPWVQAGTNGNVELSTTDSPVASGSAALPTDCGTMQFDSPTFDTAELGQVGDELIVDVFVPGGQSPWWVGSISLTIDIPSAEVWGVWIGSFNLMNLPRDEFGEVSFSLPSAVVNALLGDFPDARIRMSMNVATCGYPVVIDAIRFGGEVTTRTEFHQIAGGSPIVSSSVLTFDNVGDWTATQGTLSATSNATEGTAALQFEASDYTRIQSREFSTSELSGITNRLGFDVFIPDLPPSFYWLGYMNAFIECPSANLWRTYVGHQPLQILFDDEYNRVEFDLSSHVVGVLNGNYDDCKVSLDFVTNTAFGDFIIDNGGFVQ